jgi:hypothetical protein
LRTVDNNNLLKLLPESSHSQNINENNTNPNNINPNNDTNDSHSKTTASDVMTFSKRNRELMSPTLGTKRPPPPLHPLLPNIAQPKAKQDSNNQNINSPPSSAKKADNSKSVSKAYRSGDETADIKDGIPPKR